MDSHFAGCVSKFLIILSLPVACGQVAGASDLQTKSVLRQPTKQRDMSESDVANSNAEYMNIMSRLEQMDASGQRATLVSEGFFESLSWIGRTACLNYVCGVLSTELCRRALELGLKDEALVVRDHALRITLSAKQLTEVEKRVAAERMLEDSRNYRKGRPFWIVDRARGFLVAESGHSTAR